MKNKESIFDFTLPDLQEKILSISLKKHNAQQIFEWIYKKHLDNFDEMSNIAKTAKQTLKESFYFEKPKVLDMLVDGNDETTKFLFELADGQHIETVLMKFNYGYSVCISSQVGCNMGCKFCASGLLKKTRNLTTSEMVMQVLFVTTYLKKLNEERVSHIVVMGIGEPFDNYDNLIKFLKIVNNPFGIEIGARHITVSTCGLVPKILQFARDMTQMNMAISLHAGNDQLRSRIMPINKAYPLEKLMDAVDEYVALTNRRVSYEYILLKGVNDSEDCLEDLIHLLKGKLCFVNIIPYNRVNEHDFKCSDRANHFMKELNKHNIICTIRLEKGTQIKAACGQLRANYEK